MKGPWVIAHRGAPKKATENTLSAFEAALRLGVPSIELDIHLTKDLKFVVHHDEELGRTIKGKGLVSDYTLKELKEFQVKGGKRGEKIPTLEDVLRLCRGKCHLAVEGKLKPERAWLFAGYLAKLIKLNCTPSDVTVISFCHEMIQTYRELASKFPAGPSFEKSFDSKRVIQSKPDVVVLAKQLVTKNSATPFQEAKIPMWVFTVDDEKEFSRLEKVGVDGIITNRPDRFVGRSTREDSP